MEKAELEELKDKVPCAAVLERAGFALDVKESTRKAMKYRREASIIIVIHEGKGWFDPLGDGKGDVFRLVEHLEGVPFVHAMNDVAGLVGFVPSEPVWQRESREREPDLSIPERWQARRKPWRGSATWRYLAEAAISPSASSAPQSAPMFCAKARMAACGRPISMPMAPLPDGRSADRTGAALPPAAPRCCSGSAGPMRCASASPRRRSTP